MPKIRPLTEAGRDQERNRAIVHAVYNGKMDKGIKMTDIAARGGITVRTLQNYMKDPGRMPLQVYRDICRAVGMEVNF